MVWLWVVVMVLASSPALAQGVGDFISPGPLAESHSHLGGISKCTACHDVGGGVSATKCMVCHDGIRKEVQTGDGFHADKGESCESCHPDHQGRTFDMVKLVEDAFDHSETDFDLHGAHVEVACLDCHEDDTWRGVKKACISCHEDPHGSQVGRPILKSCDSCHTDINWNALPLPALVFDHSDPDQCDYVLDGQHTEVACQSCHEEWQFVPVQHDRCEDCHDDIHSDQFTPRACEDCHTTATAGFQLRDYDHTTTDYPLEGQHRSVRCESCHGDDEAATYVDLPHKSCATCHDDIHGGQFGAKACDSCHTVTRAGFKIPDFDHDATDWPLAGEHVEVGCSDCHGVGKTAVYVDFPHERCDSCHEDPHDGQFLPRDCVECHAVDVPGFALSGFDHDATDFPLRNKHEDVPCEDCHGDGPTGEFATLPFDDCSTCHDDVHEARFDPDRCDSCHTDGDWAVDSFDHDRTDYPLTGAHVGVECAECHGEGEDHTLAGLEAGSCMDCHADDEPHKEAMAAETCASCHDTQEWVLISYDHAAEADWPLVGKHEPVKCMECHEDPSFHLESAACEQCHADDEPPNHYEGSCDECHLSHGWLPASLGGNDHASTGFPLRGAHSELDCMSCHWDASVGPFCVDCHATDDPHRNLLGDRCEDCHNETDWYRTRFRHETTGYPLRGVHRLAACNDCHATGYAGTPSECRRCHESEKPADTLHSDPLTRDCETCHRPWTWDTRQLFPGG